MNKLALTLTILICFCLSFLSYSQDLSGNILKSDKPSFSINFPSKYTKLESSVSEGLTTDLYRSEFNKDVYMFKYTEHKSPAVSGDNEVYMDASLESFLTGIKGTLINKNGFKYGKTNGLEAFLTLDQKNLNVFYRVIILNRVQYQIIVITKDEGKSKSINAFFNSFISPLLN